MEVRVIHNITKEYPDMIKVVVFREPRVYLENEKTKRPKELVAGDYVPCYSSVNRTKTLIRDIVLCNKFDYFMTFTFDPKKVDRFSYIKCQSVMRIWLHRQHDKDKDFSYLIVPEQHKSGAWHFHALISHYHGHLRDSGVRSSSLRPVYNVTGFRSGFTTAVAIDSQEAVANYVTKYITKEFIREFNRKRFFCSRNLNRPVKTINSPIFSHSLPLFRKCVYESQDFEVYSFISF